MLQLILHLARAPCRSRQTLILENVALRHQPPGSQSCEEALSHHEEMAHDNPTWGTPRIHDELVKLGIEVSPTTVAKYMQRARPPSQNWQTFLKNHADEIVSIDFFTIPTLTCQVLYVLLMIENGSRKIVHFNVKAHPTGEWTTMRLLQAFPRDTAPRYLLRDRRLDLPTRIHFPGPSHGDRASRHVVQVALAESLFSASHRDRPPGVPRSRDRAELGPVRKRPMVDGLHHRYYREAA